MEEKMKHILFILCCSVMFWGCLEGPQGPPGEPGGMAGPDDPLRIVWTNVQDGSAGVQARKELGVLIQGLDERYTFRAKTNKFIDVVKSENAVKAYLNDVFIPIDLMWNIGWGGDEFWYAIELYSLDLYPVGKTVKVVFETNLTALDGSTLSQPYEVSFTPEPYFRLAIIDAGENYPPMNVPPQELPNVIIVPDTINEPDDIVYLDFIGKFYGSQTGHIQSSNPELHPDSIYFLTPGDTLSSMRLISSYIDPNNPELYESFRQNSEYVITINAAMEDIYGNKLPHGYEIHFFTGTWEY
jgi:hypothetical protein